MSGSIIALFAQADWIIPLLVLLGSFVVWLFNQIKAAQQEEREKREVRELVEPVRESPPKRPPQRPARPPARSQQTPARAPLSSRAPLTEESEWDRPEPVAQHVRRHLDAQEFEERTGSLGRLPELDDTVDEHVQQAFDHAVGSIGAEGGETEEAAEPTAEELSSTAAAAAGVAATLSDPDQLRSAIILQEVLRRPEWK